MSMASGFRGQAALGVIPVESQGKGAAICLVQYNNSGEWTQLKPEWADALEKYMECCPKDVDVEWCGKIWCVQWYEKGWKSKDCPQWQKESDTYTMDLRAMTQTNNTTGMVRPLLRCIVEPPSSVAALQKNPSQACGAKPA